LNPGEQNPSAGPAIRPTKNAGLNPGEKNPRAGLRNPAYENSTPSLRDAPSEEGVNID